MGLILIVYVKIKEVPHHWANNRLATKGPLLAYIEFKEIRRKCIISTRIKEGKSEEYKEEM